MEASAALRAASAGPFWLQATSATQQSATAVILRTFFIRILPVDCCLGGVGGFSPQTARTSNGCLRSRCPFSADFLSGADEMAQALGVLLPEPVDQDRRRASRRVDDDVREHHPGLNPVSYTHLTLPTKR